VVAILVFGSGVLFKQSDKYIVFLEGYSDRTQIQALTNADIRVARDELPDLPQGNHYWSDLIGLSVWTKTGQNLGIIEDLMETGSNDVLIVQGERERLIPYLPDTVILSVDLLDQKMVVDWDPEF
jgi:16S rRNA processing protein RimM